MNKRLKIQCCHCPKTYFENLNMDGQDEFIVACPYCNTRAKVTLKPYRKQPQKGAVYRGENKETQSEGEYQFPDVLPSKKIE
jgi:hypothetical protein